MIACLVDVLPGAGGGSGGREGFNSSLFSSDIMTRTRIAPPDTQRAKVTESVDALDNILAAAMEVNYDKQKKQLKKVHIRIYIYIYIYDYIYITFH